MVAAPELRTFVRTLDTPRGYQEGPLAGTLNLISLNNPYVYLFSSLYTQNP